MTLPAHIFKAYDIRGIVGEALTPDTYYRLGRGFASIAAAKAITEICVGYDGRLSSPALSQALIDGVLSTGVNVCALGMVTTPMCYFASHLNLPGQSGLMVTGSHNPAHYNGLKMVMAGETLSTEAIMQLKACIDAQAFVQGHGTLRHFDIFPAYQQAILRDISLARPLRIVVDAGNGVAGAFAPAILAALGCQVEPLFCDVDGHFPNHHPDPVDEQNLQALIAHLKSSQAELGIAFDGDGDRLGVVTRDGEVIRSDRQLMLFLPEILREQAGATVVYDVKSSRHVAQYTRALGGNPVMWKTGHSLMKAKIKDSHAAIGGELSGHLFFNDTKAGKPRWFGFDDGIYSAARLLETLSQVADATSLLKALPNGCSTPELHIHMAEGEAHALMQACQQHAQFKHAVDIITIDGLRVEYANGFGLMRASNTTPVLVLRFEADDPVALQRIQADFKTALLSVHPHLNIPF